jgi:hypothetical protein
MYKIAKKNIPLSEDVQTQLYTELYSLNTAVATDNLTLSCTLI